MKNFLLILPFLILLFLTNVNHSETLELSDCAVGYTQISDGKCYNPITKLSYKDNDFYYDGIKCGTNCDYDGRNCKEGICNVSDCMEGYNEFEWERFSGGEYPVEVKRLNAHRYNPERIILDPFKHYKKINFELENYVGCYNPNLDLFYIKGKTKVYAKKKDIYVFVKDNII